MFHSIFCVNWSKQRSTAALQQNSKRSKQLSSWQILRAVPSSHRHSSQLPPPASIPRCLATVALGRVTNKKNSRKARAPHNICRTCRTFWTLFVNFFSNWDLGTLSTSGWPGIARHSSGIARHSSGIARHSKILQSAFAHVCWFIDFPKVYRISQLPRSHPLQPLS